MRLLQPCAELVIEISRGPDVDSDRRRLTYLRASSMTSGLAPANKASTVELPHEWHRFLLINRAPQSGHVQTGRLFTVVSRPS